MKMMPFNLSSLLHRCRTRAGRMQTVVANHSIIINKSVGLALSTLTPLAFGLYSVLLVSVLFKTLKRNFVQSRLNCRSRFLLTFFCIGYLLWLNMFGIYRYLIPIEVLIPLILFVVSSYFFRTRFAWGALLLVGWITVFNLRGSIPDWGHSGWADQVYRVGPGPLSAKPEPAVVYLAGRPLGWIVPALNIDAPFIKVAPIPYRFQKPTGGSVQAESVVCASGKRLAFCHAAYRIS